MDLSNKIRSPSLLFFAINTHLSHKKLKIPFSERQGVISICLIGLLLNCPKPVVSSEVDNILFQSKHLKFKDYFTLDSQLYYDHFWI